jgi:hypothetical protein
LKERAETPDISDFIHYPSSNIDGDTIHTKCNEIAASPARRIKTHAKSGAEISRSFGGVAADLD